MIPIPNVTVGFGAGVVTWAIVVLALGPESVLGVDHGRLFKARDRLYFEVDQVFRKATASPKRIEIA